MILGNNEYLFGGRYYSPNVTHRPTFNLLPTPHRLTTNVGNHGMGVHNDGVCVFNLALNLRNSGVRFRDVITNVRNGHIYVYPKFGLGTNGQYWQHRNDGTHIKNEKDPVEVHPPAGDGLAVIFRVESSGDCMLFAPLGDLASDIRQRPAMVLIASSMEHSN